MNFATILALVIVLLIAAIYGTVLTAAAPVCPTVPNCPTAKATPCAVCATCPPLPSWAQGRWVVTAPELSGASIIVDLAPYSALTPYAYATSSANQGRGNFMATVHNGISFPVSVGTNTVQVGSSLTGTYVPATGVVATADGKYSAEQLTGATGGPVGTYVADGGGGVIIQATQKNYLVQFIRGNMPSQYVYTASATAGTYVPPAAAAGIALPNIVMNGDGTLNVSGITCTPVDAALTATPLSSTTLGYINSLLPAVAPTYLPTTQG